MAIHGVLIEGNQEIDSIAHIGDADQGRYGW